MTFDRGDVVIAPFPFTDLPVSKRRPVVILSKNEPFTVATGQVLCAMVTGARKSSWPFDVAIGDLDAAGLRDACVVRMKISTLDQRILGRVCGRLSPRDLERVDQSLLALTGITGLMS